MCHHCDMRLPSDVEPLVSPLLKHANLPWLIDFEANFPFYSSSSGGPVHSGGDVPGDDTTTVELAVGETYDGELETTGDRDWIRVELEAGQRYEISLDGSGDTPLSDPLVRLYDAAGNLLAVNDDGGPGLNSLLAYTAQTTGVYYIEVDAFSGAYTGGYTVGLDVVEPLEEYTYEQIANFLSQGYWGTNYALHFDPGNDGIITVDLTGLEEGGANAARMALQLWSDVANLTFQEVSSGADITFDDEDSGAYASFSWDGQGNITSASINISKTWSGNPGDQLYSYWLQTYIHEVGHTLGLGHGGPYNGSADYANDAAYLNDSHQMSIMSYFWPNENTWLDADFQWTLTPQIADILAVQTQYGTPTDTRTGNTTYGFNSNAGREVFDANNFSSGAFPAMTIFDSAGTDTLDFSGFDVDQIIDLAAAGVSSVGGMTGNLLIALNTIIERAIGGGGNDTLSGNGVNNTIWGNAGDDTINGLGGNDFLLGGLGNDTLEGGDGDDILDGGDGNDTLEGGDGVDRIYGGAGRDAVGGGVGNDILIGGDGDDVLNGQGGADKIRGGNDDDTIRGGADDDILLGQNGADTVYGDGGDDYLAGGASDDVLFGGTGNDLIGGGGGNDTLDGGDGDDIVTGNGGNDSFTGGAGNDRFDGGGGQADRAVFSGNFADYQLEYFGASGMVRVTDLRDGSPDGQDRLFRTEFLDFADGSAEINGGAFDFTASAPAAMANLSLGDTAGVLSMLTEAEDLTLGRSEYCLQLARMAGAGTAIRHRLQPRVLPGNGPGSPRS